MIIYRQYPFSEIVYRKTTFCMITSFTAWNYVIAGIPLCVIYPINPIVQIYSIKSISIFSRYLLRRLSTIMTRTRRYFSDLVFGKIPFISSLHSLFIHSIVHFSKCRLPFWTTNQTSTTFSSSFSFSQIHSHYGFQVPAITSTKPLSPKSRSTFCVSIFSYYNKFSVSMPCKVYSLPCHIYFSLKEYLRKMVLLSRQYLYNFRRQFTSISPFRYHCLDTRIIP